MDTPRRAFGGLLGAGNWQGYSYPCRAGLYVWNGRRKLFPAVIEARLSRTPLILLTADRPPELRDCGAPQTIDQIHLYGRYPRFFSDLPVPESGTAAMGEWAVEADRAMENACGPPGGPVHLNLPFREPLIPSPERLGEIVATADIPGKNAANPPGPRSNPLPGHGTWDVLAERVRTTERGIIICGPQNTANDLGATVHRLAMATGYPVLADVASQVRFGEHADDRTLSHFDLFLRDPRLAEELVPDFVFRLGGLPTSKTLNTWLRDASVSAHVLIDDHDGFADPDRCATQKIACPLAMAGEEIGKRLTVKSAGPNAYADRWRAADNRVRHVLDARRCDGTEVFGGDIVAALFEYAPSDSVIYLSNSMSIRFADSYAHAKTTRLRVLVNRGANGIDGVVSSAVGAASALDATVILVTGDVGLLHDINGLLGAGQYALNLKMVLLNDDGGGIFSFLPIAAHGDVFESLVAMPHGRDFGKAASFYGVKHHVCSGRDEFVRGFQDCLQRRGPEILEVRTDRARSEQTVREIAGQIAGLRTGGR